MRLFPHRINPVVKQRVIDTNHQGPQIDLIRIVTREMWAEEDEVTREVVTKVLAAEAKQREDDEAAAAERNGADPTPQQYQE